METREKEHLLAHWSGLKITPMDKVVDTIVDALAGSAEVKNCEHRTSAPHYFTDWKDVILLLRMLAEQDYRYNLRYDPKTKLHTFTIQKLSRKAEAVGEAPGETIAEAVWELAKAECHTEEQVTKRCYRGTKGCIIDHEEAHHGHQA